MRAFRPVVAALAGVAMASALTSCGGASKATPAPRASAAPADDAAQSVGSDNAVTGPGGPVDAHTGRAAPGPATRRQVGGATNTTAAPSSPRAAAGGRVAGSPTAPGHYAYDVTGSEVIGPPGSPAVPVSDTSQLVADPPANGSQHWAWDSKFESAEYQFSFLPTGITISFLNLTNPAFSKDFDASPPVSLWKGSARPGDTWQWALDSRDHKTHIDVHLTFQGTEVRQTPSGSVDTVVLHSLIEITGDQRFTMDRTMWLSPAYSLFVHVHDVVDGTMNGVPVHDDITNAIQALTPT
jgi:hypothetical protein